MSTNPLDAAKDAKEKAQQGDLRDNDAGIPEELRVDWDEHEPKEVNGHAESFITFSHIARIGINDYGAEDDLLDMAQNLRGAGRYGYDLEITLADPTIVNGEVWVDAPDDPYPEYKVIGDPNSDDNDHEIRQDVTMGDDGTPEDVEIKGINVSETHSWDGQPVSEFDPDYITVSIAARRATDLLGTLDTAGQWFSSREGDVIEGLFEAPPNFGTDAYDPDKDGYPRLVGYPELRADMVGQRGAIAFTYGDPVNGNKPKEVTVFKLTEPPEGGDAEDGVVTEIDGEDVLMEALSALTPDDPEYALPTYPRGSRLFWDDTQPSADEVGADAEPENNGGVAEAKAMVGGTDNSGRDNDDAERGSAGSTSSATTNDDEITSVEDLTADGTEFVDDALDAMAAQGYESVTEFDDFDERVAAVDAEADLRADADTLAEIIDAEKGA